MKFRQKTIKVMEEILKQVDHWGLRWEVQKTMVKMMQEDASLPIEIALDLAASEWDV